MLWHCYHPGSTLLPTLRLGSADSAADPPSYLPADAERYDVIHPIQRGHGVYNGGIPFIREMTPEERYIGVLAWVRARITKEVAS